MRTVVFDLGQVVVKWDPYRAQEGFISEEEWEDFLERTDFWTVNHGLDAGKTIREVREAFARRFPSDLAIFDRHIENFPRTLTGPVPGVEKIIDDLHAFGVKTAVLSNWSAELFKHALTAMPVINRLGMRIVSGEVGLAKPDPAIFRLLLERLREPASKVVFIDDNVANIEAAGALGIDAILFQDATQLRSELASRCIIPATERRS
ncbi:MAG: HAD family phosphatase [Actinomycetaceae bacterium]|nr:HAD family phosphatase [Actinomycetaceae bacterium]